MSEYTLSVKGVFKDQISKPLEAVKKPLETIKESVSGIGDVASKVSGPVSSFGSLLKANLASSAITSGLSAIKDGIESITESVSGFAKDAIAQGADLEQSIGGVETLFGDAADTVKAYAQDAFETAGVSANDYMQNVTSFAATLVKGLGGDTAKAAEVANTAMVDMADNANKMGTSLGSIQNAYQGFAKQNYTINYLMSAA